MMLEARRGGGWVAGKVDINTWDIRDVADAQVYTHAHTHARTHARTHACTHVFVCACQSVCVCMHVRMHACICTYAATKSTQELSLKRAEL